MNDKFSEDIYEQTLIELFQELGYRYEYGPDMTRDYKEPLLEQYLLDALQRINPTVPVDALEDDNFLAVWGEHKAFNLSFCLG